MFYALLIVTLAVALVTALAVVRFFDSTIRQILRSVIGPELADAWAKYLSFAIVVVGVSGGVRLWELEKYIANPVGAGKEVAVMVLSGERWVLEIYRTLIETLRSISWLMLLFFLAAMVAYVVMKVIEQRK
jgi:hypothetical protein